MNKHTPGPWGVNPSGLAIVKRINDRGDGYDWDHIAVVSTARPEHLVNARLIAAAPDLLAACEMAMLEETNPHILAVLQAAIAKATSE